MRNGPASHDAANCSRHSKTERIHSRRTKRFDEENNVAIPSCTIDHRNKHTSNSQGGDNHRAKGQEDVLRIAEAIEVKSKWPLQNSTVKEHSLQKWSEIPLEVFLT
jgi:hypothetical protein